MRPSRVLLLVLALVLGWAGPAAAHTALISADPAPGASVDSPPEKIVLTFTEPLRQPSSASVVVDGKDHEAKVSVAGARLVVTPVEPIAGNYRVSYRVVSADGHPISGTTDFTVGSAPANPTDSPLERPSTGPSSEPSAAASSAPAAEAPQEADDRDGIPSALWIGLAAVVAIALAAFALVRVRSGARDDHA